MAWSKPLPDTAKVGDPGHVADHDEIVAAITEARTAIDAAETKAAWGSVTGKPSTFPPTIGTTATTALAGNTPLLQIGTTATTAKAGNYTPSSAEVAAGLKAKSQVAALSNVSAADAPVAAGDTPTKAEYDKLVTLANANKAAINAIVAALKA